MKSTFGSTIGSLYLLLLVAIGQSCNPAPSSKIHKSHIIEIRQMKFNPSELIIMKGDTVTWVNKDIVTHDVTEEANKSWSSSALEPGKSWSLVVPGTVDYYCSIHVVMKGKIEVR